MVVRSINPLKCVLSVVIFSFLFSASAQASEKDELALVMRQLDQVQAALNRAQVIASQNAGDSARYYFDYSSATRDITAMKLGIERYLQPSRAQPAVPMNVTGQYSQESR
ncbi:MULTISPECIES: RAQPRD family integrative conjugative element protein [Pectobacteriaceae]|uniref:RAQPRD family integrative conjugative element protein n=1 Tax=Dickeya oryzae TaxID=1240404 RepID=A0AB39IRA0_9GAMM|nr:MULTISPECIES: RAQPRD family integrative conjugative element protein [Pectobacteriaceae]MCA6990807.1 integrative conjugative element protein, RAQPRD family [Dickeya oryzae]